MTRLFAPHPNIKLVISDAQQDNSKPVAQVKTFIRQKPDLLIVAPNERAALTAVMGQAMEAKIPVICLEINRDRGAKEVLDKYPEVTPENAALMYEKFTLPGMN